MGIEGPANELGLSNNPEANPFGLSIGQSYNIFQVRQGWEGGGPASPDKQVAVGEFVNTNTTPDGVFPLFKVNGVATPFNPDMYTFRPVELQRETNAETDPYGYVEGAEYEISSNIDEGRYVGVYERLEKDSTGKFLAWFRINNFPTRIDPDLYTITPKK